MSVDVETYVGKTVRRLAGSRRKPHSVSPARLSSLRRGMRCVAAYRGRRRRGYVLMHLKMSYTRPDSLPDDALLTAFAETAGTSTREARKRILNGQESPTLQVRTSGTNAPSVRSS